MEVVCLYSGGKKEVILTREDMIEEVRPIYRMLLEKITPLPEEYKEQGIELCKLGITHAGAYIMPRCHGSLSEVIMNREKRKHINQLPKSHRGSGKAIYDCAKETAFSLVRPPLFISYVGELYHLFSPVDEGKIGTFTREIIERYGRPKIKDLWG